MLCMGAWDVAKLKVGWIVLDTSPRSKMGGWRVEVWRWLPFPPLDVRCPGGRSQIMLLS